MRPLQLAAFGITCASAAWWPVLAQAVAVGGLNTQSYYGQPVRLEIELFALDGALVSQLSARIITIDSAVTSPHHESALKSAKIGSYQAGNIGWILIETSEPIYSGAIEFQLEVLSRGARVVRKYRTGLFGAEQALPPTGPDCPVRGARMRCLD